MPPATGPDRVGAVIVTHNSEGVVGHALAGLRDNGIPARNVWVVDSGSLATTYLADLRAQWPFHFLPQSDNVGFARANNLAIEELLRTRMDLAICLFVNPDLKLPAEWLAGLLSHLDKPEAARIGLASSPLLGIDLAVDRPTGMIDSLGIMQKWYGRWHDLGQQIPVGKAKIASAPYAPIALCAALMAVRRELLEEIWRRRGAFFDEKFYMYKEDIEVSLLARKLGWELRVFPDLKAFHQRGWSEGVRAQQDWQRELSARNDVIVAWRYRQHALPFAVLKWAYVHSLERFVARGAARAGGRPQVPPDSQ